MVASRSISPSQICAFLCFSTLIMLPYEYKLEIVKLITKSIVPILLISFFGWFLVVIIRVHLPYTEVSFADQYYFRNYHIFLLRHGKVENVLDFVRYCSLFIEPGYIGVACVLLLHVNDFNFKDKNNIIILFISLVTLSLATYLLLFLTYLFRHLNRKGIKYLILFSLIMIILFIIFLNKEDSIIYQKIISRLLPDNKGRISGNNRFTPKLDKFYEQFKSSNSLFWGIGSEEFKAKDFGSNAGYKVYIITYGLVGVFIALFYYFMTALRSFSKKSITFFIIWFLAFLQASYPLNGYQLILFIIGCEILSSKERINELYQKDIKTI